MISFSRRHQTLPRRLRSAERRLARPSSAGEMVFVTGHSGAGKSTLLKLMAAIERPTRGTVLVNGQNVGALRDSAAAVPAAQFRARSSRTTSCSSTAACSTTSMLPLSIIGYDRREAARRVRAALDKVGLLGKEKAHPVTLSGGEQQRLAHRARHRAPARDPARRRADRQSRRGLRRRDRRALQARSTRSARPSSSRPTTSRSPRA